MTTITLASLAAILNKNEEEVILPNGSTKSVLNWKGEDLSRLDDHLRNLGFSNKDHIVFDGPGPAFIGLALVHAVHPGYSSLNDPRIGPVAIPLLKPKGISGSGPVAFKVIETQDYFLLEFNCGATFDVADLCKVVPPDISGKGIIISGRGPNWLTVSLGMAFHAKGRWVACNQPGTGATVAMTHLPTMKLGTLIQLESAAVTA